MDDITASLQSLLRQRFHITPSVTSRHDQWFKRVYQSWMSVKDNEVLILTPKDARAEWAPEMLQFSAQLARHIRDQAAAQRQQLDTSFPPREDKLFADAVLDEPPLLCPLPRRPTPALCPRVQRGDWWPNQDLVDLAYVSKALLEHEQIAALLAVAKMRGVDLKDASDSRKHKHDRWGGPRTAHEGWGTMVDEALLVFFFAAIVGTFPESLLKKTGKCKYTNWLPYGQMLGEIHTPMRFVRALESSAGFKGLRSWDDLQPHMERCVRILTATEILNNACGLAGIDWEERTSSAMLYFVGFEAWNREREGDRYLHCKLNTTKDEKWLTHGLEGGETEEKVEKVIKDENKSDAIKSKLVRQPDPLRLREPRVELTDEEDEEEQEKLAKLEREEAAYGSRRSEKYRRRRASE